MNRRSFLSKIAIFNGAAVLGAGLSGAKPVIASAQAEPLQKSFDLSRDKKTILVSYDKGKRWSTSLGLQPHLTVLDLATQGDEMRALIGVQEHEFVLRSLTGQKWLSFSDAVPLAALGPAAESEPMIGSVELIGFDYAPRDWAFCQGQILSIPS
jgi:hypothetical protein